MADSITLTGDSTSAPVRIGGHVGADNSVRGGVLSLHFYAGGNGWQGATLKIQFSADGTNGWATMKTDNTLATDFSATADGMINIDCESGYIRYVLSGSGSPEPSITVAIGE